MRALSITAPWGPDAIQVVEAPDPAPGHGQVLVRMKACSLNYRDFLMIHGMYGRGPPRRRMSSPLLGRLRLR